MIDNVERLLGFAEACRKQMQEPNMSDGDKAMLEIDAARHEAAAEEIQQLRARCEELDSLNDIDLAARDDLIQKLRAEVADLRSANSSLAEKGLCRAHADPLKCELAPCNSCVHYMKAERDRLRELLREAHKAIYNDFLGDGYLNDLGSRIDAALKDGK